MSKAATPRSYELSPHVRAQIERLAPAGSPDFWNQLAIRDKNSPRWLDAEVLVIVLRRFLFTGDIDSARRVGEEILDRWARFVQSWAWSQFPESVDDRADMCQEAHTRLWARIFDPDQSFWEANFIHALRCLCIDVGKSLAADGQREIPIPQAQDEHGELLDELPDIADPQPQDFDGRLLREESAARVSRALAELPIQARRAVFLYYIKGWQITSDDSTKTTISSALKVSEKTVRNYLRHGEELLRAWYARSE